MSIRYFSFENMYYFISYEKLFLFSDIHSLRPLIIVPDYRTMVTFLPQSFIQTKAKMIKVNLNNDIVRVTPRYKIIDRAEVTKSPTVLRV
jgi:hypothetical protein